MSTFVGFLALGGFLGVIVWDSSDAGSSSSLILSESSPNDNNSLSVEDESLPLSTIGLFSLFLVLCMLACGFGDGTETFVGWVLTVSPLVTANQLS